MLCAAPSTPDQYQELCAPTPTRNIRVAGTHSGLVCLSPGRSLMTSSWKITVHLNRSSFQDPILFLHKLSTEIFICRCAPYSVRLLD